MSVASDETAARIRALLGHKPGVVEKKMFGGVGFMLHGHMVAGSTSKGAVMLRVDPTRQDEALQRPGASPMHMGEKQMNGFISISDEGVATDEALADWLHYAERYVKTLAPK